MYSMLSLITGRRNCKREQGVKCFNNSLMTATYVSFFNCRWINFYQLNNTHLKGIWLPCLFHLAYVHKTWTKPEYYTCLAPPQQRHTLSVCKWDAKVVTKVLIVTPAKPQTVESAKLHTAKFNFYISKWRWQLYKFLDFLAAGFCLSKKRTHPLKW